MPPHDCSCGCGDAKFPKGSPIDLAQAIDYADGGIVSRTVAENDAGGLTLFAFDAGEGLSEHSAPFDAIVLALEGEADITIAGETTRVEAGQMIIMPANVPHALKAPTRFKMLLTMLRA